MNFVHIDESNWSLDKCCPLKTVRPEGVKANI